MGFIHKHTHTHCVQRTTRRSRLAFRFGICHRGISFTNMFSYAMHAVFAYSKMNSLYVRHCIRASTIAYFVFICVFRSNIGSSANVPSPELSLRQGSPSPAFGTSVCCCVHERVHFMEKSIEGLCGCVGASAAQHQISFMCE